MLTGINNRSDYENSINKLLLHAEKCKAITAVASGTAKYDASLPICIEIHLTNVCNLKCDWCIDRKIRAICNELPLDALIGLLDDIAGSDVGLTIEGGGEPTMHREFETFIRECGKRNINIGLITNGTIRLSRDILPYFDFIRVSLDASTPQEYIVEKGRDCFDAVIANLKYIRENEPGLVLGISYVLNKRNTGNLHYLFEQVKDLNLNYIRMRNVEENDDLALDHKEMQRIKRVLDEYNQMGMRIVLSADTDTNLTNNNGLPCVAHSLRALIVASGDVYMCSKRRHDPLVLGNIKGKNFLEIWNSPERTGASKKLLDCKSQLGCSVCRITKYNELFINITKVRTSSFI